MTILKFVRKVGKSPKSQAVNKHVEDSKQGQPDSSQNICGKCTDEIRGCVSALFGGYEAGFRRDRPYPIRMREAGEACPAILVAHIVLSRAHASVLLVTPSRSAPAYLSAAPLDFFSFFFGGTVVFFFHFVFFFCFFFHFVHPLTRAASRFSLKCDTNGAIQI